MIRRVFTIASAICLLLCTATVVLWVRSYHLSDEMEWLLTPGSSTTIGTVVKFCNASGGSDLEVHRFTTDVPLNPRPGISEFQGVPVGMSWFHRQLWRSRAAFFDYFWISDRGVRENPHLLEQKFFVATPHWFLIIITLVLPIALGVRWLLRRIAVAPGHCPTCRYDLTGNTSGVSPECGVDIDPHAVPPATLAPSNAGTPWGIAYPY